ncbi:MAG: isochorismatase family protein [Brevibacterium sp.]|nr:isochorismatase family protein [Brevibacterium sp.]
MSTARRALVIVDVQQQYFDGPLEIQYPSHEQSLPKIAAAIDAAVAADIPVAVIQHTMGTDAPVFNPNEPGYALHPKVAQRQAKSWKSVVKEYGSVYADTDLEAWLRDKDVDTVTLVGYMTNNCILASAAEAEVLGFTTEVLSDATGAINIANDAGFADAKTVHTTLMALLHSNWAAVASTEAWSQALASQEELPKGDLGTSAVTGAQKAGQD